MIAIKPIDAVVSILTSESRELKYLAGLSGRDPFLFYRESDLKSLNLSDQDLTGLSFRGADVRFANFKSATFDQGAFNGAITDENQAWLIDDFEFDIEDIKKFRIDQILIFCRIRSGLVDYIIKELGINYSSFADKAGVSVNALRKARHQSVIAFDTARSVLLTLNDLCCGSLEALPGKVFNLLKQPLAQFVSGGINGAFRPITRGGLNHLFQERERSIEVNKRIGYSDYLERFRLTPEYILSVSKPL